MYRCGEGERRDDDEKSIEAQKMSLNIEPSATTEFERCV
jgi:hypothetical protein